MTKLNTLIAYWDSDEEVSLARPDYIRAHDLLARCKARGLLERIDDATD